MSMIGNFATAADATIEALLAEPEGIDAFLYPDDEAKAPPHLDVAKAWHAIHFLLTGDAWGGEPPLDFIASGGAPIGEVDVGYGPARAFTSAEVAAIAVALAPITEEALCARWDPSAIRAAEIYAVDPDEEGGYVGGAFESLKAFVAAAARDRLGMIVYVN